ncbi:MAG: YbaY family lipoprotein, partial [Candidatus Acidiferrum sp.]
MKIKSKLASLALGILSPILVLAQEPAAPPNAPTSPPHNNVVKAIPWKQFNYTCAGGTKLTVYLAGDLAKVRYGDHTYLMRQAMAADGNRYSDGKVVWWGKGNGGFLQEDAPDGNGKLILTDCKLNKPLNAETATITGTVSYLQRIALPTNAVIELKLLDTSQGNAGKAVAEETLNLGQRQVPIPFTLNYDPAKIDPKHAYSVSAKITVNN